MIGEVSVTQIIAALARQWCQVWVPFGDSNRRTDILFEKHDLIKRVQCKTGRLVRGAIEFRTDSTHRSQKGYKHRDYVGQVDYFGVYCPQTKKCYLVPISKTKKCCCFLRIDPPKTSKSKARWAKDFELP